MDHAKFAEAAGGKGYVLKDPSRIAVQYDLPMTIFVMNNKQLSFIKYEQQAAGVRICH